MKSRGKSSLKRSSPKRGPKRYFYLFSEGKNTEKDYFSALQRTLDAREVKIIYYGPIGVPKTVAEKSIDFARDKGLLNSRRSRHLDSFEQGDEVWAVFDRDEFTCYLEAKQMCKGAGVDVAYSDPCFELWINLHFDDHDAPCDRHQAQSITKSLLDGYDPKSGKTADFSLAIQRVGDAEIRGKRLRSNRIAEANENGNPSTSVYELTKRLRGIKDE